MDKINVGIGTAKTTKDPGARRTHRALVRRGFSCLMPALASVSCVDEGDTYILTSSGGMSMGGAAGSSGATSSEAGGEGGIGGGAGGGSSGANTSGDGGTAGSGTSGGGGSGGTPSTDLFFDDFEDGMPTEWMLIGDTWSIVTDSTNVYETIAFNSSTRGSKCH